MRKGTLQARAIKDAGRWRLMEFTLELTQPDEHIGERSDSPSATIKAVFSAA
jgi:hypothetical protein